MIVGTAGHIDHGKTALIKALTGVDTDRLQEEKARGISIELGYAYLPLAAAADADHVIGFVDVPGHERFVHHMLAGATGIDFVMLIVAADDGAMPQTREHLQILDLLGIRQGVVVLTKIDRVATQRAREVADELRALLAGTTLALAPVFPVSAINGEGIAALRRHLADCAQRLPMRDAGGHFRLAVDRCFSLPGAGTIVTGTVHAGKAAVGDRMLISPGGKAVRIRGMHVQNQVAESCQAGQRCALNLAGTQFGKDDVNRGDWILPAALHRPTQALDVQLRVLPDAARPLRHLAPLHFHLGAAHTTARLTLLEATALRPGQTGLAHLSLFHTIGAVAGDRFVVRDAAAARTIAGGVVLDPFPPRRGRRVPQRLDFLRAWAEGGGAAALNLALEQDSSIDLVTFATAANLRFDEIESLCDRQRGVRIRRGNSDLLMSARKWSAHRERIMNALAEAHARNSGEPGLTREQLRRSVSADVDEAVFVAIVDALLAHRELAASGLALHLPDHKVKLTSGDESLWGRLQPLLAVKMLAPPRIDQLARQLGDIEEAGLGPLLDRVAKTGAVYRVSEQRYYLPEAVRELAKIVTDTAGGNTAGALQPVTAAGIRDRTGIGRNIVIQILEFFDRAGLTRRVGDVHWLRREHREMFGVDQARRQHGRADPGQGD